MKKLTIHWGPNKPIMCVFLIFVRWNFFEYAEKGYFDPQTACKAPIGNLKYTTLIVYPMLTVSCSCRIQFTSKICFDWENWVQFNTLIILVNYFSHVTLPRADLFYCVCINTRKRAPKIVRQSLKWKGLCENNGIIDKCHTHYASWLWM